MRRTRSFRSNAMRVLRLGAGPVRGQPHRVLGRKAASRETTSAPDGAPRPRPPASAPNASTIRAILSVLRAATVGSCSATVTSAAEEGRPPGLEAPAYDKQESKDTAAAVGSCGVTRDRRPSSYFTVTSCDKPPTVRRTRRVPRPHLPFAPMNDRSSRLTWKRSVREAPGASVHAHEVAQPLHRRRDARVSIGRYTAARPPCPSRWPVLRTVTDTSKPAANVALSGTEVGVLECRVREAGAELELRLERLQAEARVLDFRDLVVVREQRVGMPSDSDRQAAARIHVAKQDVRDRISPFEARIERRRQSPARGPRSAWISRGRPSIITRITGLPAAITASASAKLRRRKRQVVDVAGRFGVRHLAKAQDDGVRVGRSSGRCVRRRSPCRTSRRARTCARSPSFACERRRGPCGDPSGTARAGPPAR